MSGRLIIMFLGSALGAGTWNYNQCDLVNGPFAWPAVCTPNQLGGTPIDLCGGVLFPNTYTPSITATGYNVARFMNIQNPGYTLQVDIIAGAGAAPTVKVGDLPTVVGRSDTAGSNNPDWTLGQMHLHWGRTGKLNEGSEHYIQGQAYDVEAHFVHYNPTLPLAAGGTANSVASAVGTGKKNALLVIGVMLRVGATDVDVIKAIADEAATATKTATQMKTQVTLSNLLDTTKAWYSYGGGLTTPTCNEQVTWIVMKEPMSILSTTLDLIKNGASTNPPLATAGASPLISLYGNFRPLQKLGGRTVYSSDVATPACGTPTQPNFGCSAAFMVSPSIVTPLAAMLSIVLLAIWN